LVEERLGPGPTRELIGKFSAELKGDELANLMKAISRSGDPETAADFFIQVLKGPPAAAQLMVIRIAERPGWRRIPRLDQALAAYQSDFDSLTQAFSYYQDRAGCQGKCGR
jgi:hypothetical protein